MGKDEPVVVGAIVVAQQEVEAAGPDAWIGAFPWVHWHVDVVPLHSVGSIHCGLLDGCEVGTDFEWALDPTVPPSRASQMCVNLRGQDVFGRDVMPSMPMDHVGWI